MQNIIKIMDREDKDTSYRNRGVTLMGVHALEFIKGYVKQHNIPPTQREIHDYLNGEKGYGKSPNGLSYAIKKLVASGKIKKEGATRNLWPVENKE